MNFPKIKDNCYKGFTLKQTDLGASCIELKWQCFEDDYDLIIFKFKLYVDEALKIYELVKSHKDRIDEKNREYIRILTRD